MSDAFSRLQELLRELFQFDNKDLDFGIYRIMNHKRGAVEDFIRYGLANAVDEALKGGAVTRQAARAEELQRKTEQVKETFGEYAIGTKGELNESFRETPLGKEYLEARDEAGEPVDLEELRATIFNHVYTFFSRYYDNGDFLSKRRYSRRQKYAIPYNGEEVYLHWANADQYYIKTGEHFTDYRYKAPDGVTVHFELESADTEQNNVKGDKRFFVPRTKEAAYDEESRTLTVPFEYRPLTAKEEKAYGTRNQQEKVIAEAAEQLPNRFQQSDALSALISEKRKNAKGEPVSLLEHHLRRYTRRNTSDFFVHKDLEGFLEGELDFYLKNEVLDVDDLDSWGPDRSESWFEVMRAVKGVGRSIIAFLAQIEDFQKKLFEKKKLVVAAGYCLTLDRVPEELYEEVAACEAQREEWVRLFAIDEIEENITTPGYTEPLTVDFLIANPHLVLDTEHFGDDFEDRLLAGIEDLDGQLDGLLVESENFQALNLLQERYREQVKCIYIDPPYNTGNDAGFVYKDSYQHSSWLSMMEGRLRLGRELLSEHGANFISIDDRELLDLGMLVNRVFGTENFLANFVRKRRMATGMRGEPVSPDHEYVVAHAKADENVQLFGNQRQEIDYPYEDSKSKYRSTDLTVGMTKDMRPNQFYAIHNPRTGKEYWPPDNRVWRFQPSTMQNLLETEIIWPDDHPDKQLKRPRFKTRFDPEANGSKTVPVSTWMSTSGREASDEATENLNVLVAGMNQEATKELKDLFGFQAMDYPKPVSLPLTLAKLATISDDTVLDFFAGSGTTGHAVIDLNREDGGDRRYVLVEMGEYFDTVTKPRILKVIYSKDWKDGKPVSREGTSHALKYLKLESYEDALDNIAFTHEKQGQEALELYGDDYRLRYMLDFETRGSDSLLNVEKLSAPFRYELRLRGTPGGEKRPTTVDLPETFTYLLGLRVRTRKAHHDGERRYLVYRGASPERGEVAAIWRDTEGWQQADYERDEQFVREEGLADGADEVFVNGDSFIAEARPLEAVFKERMLDEPVRG